MQLRKHITQVRRNETPEEKQKNLSKGRECYKHSKKCQNPEIDPIGDLVAKFHKDVSEGPLFICTCCSQLWYKHSVCPAERTRLSNPNMIKHLQNIISVDKKEWICRSCNEYLKKNKVPPCAITNGMGFPKKPNFFYLNGVPDTMLTAADFLDDSERQQTHNVAPGEGSRPLSIFRDQYSEELAYPGIFLGQKRPDDKQRLTSVYYSDICKSELRRSDRRAAMCIENIFFKTKKLQMKILLGKSQIALRKCKGSNRTLTAGELKNPGNLERLIRHDEGYKFLRALRGSPPYFEKAKKDLFAMIRQLGPATLFCSFSSAETKWIHLLRILGNLVDNKNYSDDELENLNWEEKCRLIQGDPVTCARRFDYQFNTFLKTFLMSDVAPLGKIKDWFYRVEYQQIGSPHIHMMLWLEDAPVFGIDKDEDVISFIDQIITCETPKDNADLLDLVNRQTHRHSHTCRKRSKSICRFNYPQPPMRTTQILYPLDDSFSGAIVRKLKESFKNIKKILNDLKEGEDISFHQLFINLGVSEEDYILAIRSSLNCPTIFLKRKPNELRVNNYNPACLSAWRTNMDVQFILDVYNCAMYIVSYISKAQKGMSELLRKACAEAKEGNANVKRQVRDIGNKFLNSVEISAQEAVYIILQLPMRKSSREVIFIHSTPPEERVQLLKPINEIEQMPDKSEEIHSGGLLKRYIERPVSFKNVTLTDWAEWYDSCHKHSERNTKKLVVDQLPLGTQGLTYEAHSFVSRIKRLVRDSFTGRRDSFTGRFFDVPKSLALLCYFKTQT